MKKISSFILLLAFAFTLVPGMVLATHGGPHDPDTGNPVELPGGYQTPQEILDLIETVTNWIFAIFILAAVVFVVLAAFQFITGGPDGAKEARGKLVWAVIGVAIALLARGIVPIVKNILGV